MRVICPRCGGLLVRDVWLTFAHRATIYRCMTCGYLAEELNLDLDEQACGHDRRD
jgi:uncharacterized Zn finger protein